jgi:hypothetical protein
MKLSPIIVFAYKRPIHLKKVLDALSKNPESYKSTLYIFCDGFKNGASDDTKKNVQEVRKIALEEKRFYNTILKFHDTNLGLSKSIISGVTEVLNYHDKCIVLEDDIVPNLGFLNYMNQALSIYYTNDYVACIHAWNYNLKNLPNNSSSFFLKGADCWGWATWKRAWDLLNLNGNEMYKEILDKNLEYSFNRNGTHNFLQMLNDQIHNKNDSWAILWHASCFLNNQYCLHPCISIVSNIGFDSTGENCKNDIIDQSSVEHIVLKKIKVQESEWFFSEYNRKYKKFYAISITQKFKSIFKKYYASLFFPKNSKL